MNRFALARVYDVNIARLLYEIFQLVDVIRKTHRTHRVEILLDDTLLLDGRLLPSLLLEVAEWLGETIKHEFVELELLAVCFD